jgi:hypothetical protein
MNHAKTSFSTEICAGAIISVVQYVAPLRYVAPSASSWGHENAKNTVVSLLAVKVACYGCRCGCGTAEGCGSGLVGMVTAQQKSVVRR